MKYWILSYVCIIFTQNLQKQNINPFQKKNMDSEIIFLLKKENSLGAPGWRIR